MSTGGFDLLPDWKQGGFAVYLADSPDRVGSLLPSAAGAGRTIAALLRDFGR